MSMFNKCHIHLCDCTWLNVFSHAQSLLIKHKKIFECFNYFWKVFYFCKNVKNFKNSVALFWRLSRKLVQSHVPVVSPHRDFSRLTGRSMPQSRKILRIFFKIWVFNVNFLRLSLATCSRVKGPVVRRLRNFCGIPRDSLTSRTSSREKHLDKFFKIFFLSVLATGPGDLLATWLNPENHVFCANRLVFKRFQFFPRTSVTIHCLPYLKLSQTHRVTLEQTSIFTSFQLKIFKKKV